MRRLFCAFLIVTFVAVAAHSTEARLLRPLQTTKAVSESNAPEVLASMPVAVDFDALSEALEAGSTLAFDLAPDLEARAVAERVWLTGDESFAWKARVVGHPLSSAVLAVRQGVLAGGISVGPRRFQIRLARDGHYRVDEIDVSELPDGNDMVLPPTDQLSAGSLSARPRPVSGKAKTNLDIVVFYTKKAKNEAGGKAAIEALIELGVAETNTALDDSKAKAKIRLKDLQQISYKAKKDMSKDLGRLQDTNDGKLDAVHAVRNAENADFVVLIVRDRDPDRCGIGYLSPKAGTAAAAFAFSVTRVDCISPNYTFGHELGHNWGLAHTRNSSNVDPFIDYGYGFYGPDALFRTIMAVFRFGEGRRVLHYSNPKVRERGERTGVKHKKPDGADASRAIRDAKALLSSYR